MTVNNLIRIVSNHVGVDIRERKRNLEYVLGRAIFYEIAYKKLHLGSLSYIGKQIGVDHSTIVHSNANVFPHIKTHYPDTYSAYLTILDEIGIDNNYRSMSINHRFDELQSRYKELIEERKRYISSASSNSEVREMFKAILELPEDKVSKLKVRFDSIIHML